MKIEKSSIGSKLRWWYYWYYTRQVRKIIPWIARKLPARVKYWVIIDGMVKVEPQNNPSYVMGVDILRLWEDKVK